MTPDPDNLSSLGKILPPSGEDEAAPTVQPAPKPAVEK